MIRYSAVFASVVLLFASCGGNDCSLPTSTCPVDVPSDNVPPDVFSVHPKENAVGVSVTDTVTATFTESVDTTSVNTNTFTLEKMASVRKRIVGTVTVSGAVATFTPSEDLEYLTEYIVTVKTGVTDTAGNALSRSYEWSFTTVVAPDTNPPTIVSVSPEDDTTNASVTSTVIATFSESVDPATVTSNTFVVMRDSDSVTGSLEVDSTIVTFVPSADLLYLTKYTVTVMTGVTDTAGNPLRVDYEWSFTTEEDPTWILDEGYSADHVSVNSNGAYVIGTTRNLVAGVATQGFFVTKFNLVGKREWLFEVNSREADYGCGIFVQNGIVYVGRMQDPLGLGDADVYVDMLNEETGTLIRSVLVGEHTMCFDIVANDESVYVVGWGEVIRLDAQTGNVQGLPLTVKNIGGSRATTTFKSIDVGPGAVYVSGSTSRNLVSGELEGNGGDDFFVVAYEKDFSNRLWLSQWGNSLDQINPDVVVAPASNRVYLVGFSGDLLGPAESRATILLAYKLSSGEFLWSLDRGASFPKVAGDGNDAYVVVRRNVSSDQSLLRVDPDGAILWTANSPVAFNDGRGNAAVSAGTLFVANNTNKLLRYNTADGVAKQKQ